MVSVFGYSLESVFTNGDPVEAIYANGVKVWPEITPSPGEYYIKWWPRSTSGSFVMDGEARWLQSYSGYYSGPFHFTTTSLCRLDDEGFKYTGVQIVETNAEVFGVAEFQECTSLLYISAPQCSRVLWPGYPQETVINRANTFYGCTSLKGVYFPELSFLGYYQFNSCSALTDVYLPECRIVFDGAFKGCTMLQDISLPMCTYIGNEVFLGCTSLSEVYLGNCSTIRASAFERCSNLTTIINGYSGVCSGIGAARSEVDIYVPLEWVSEYKSQYSNRASHIFPISN